MVEAAVDLRADTKTRPCPGMRAAMAQAIVGDEQQDEDPTVAELNARVAGILGKASAVFLPSGTMANVVSTLVHCAKGDEILADATSHVIHLETGSVSGLAGAVTTPIAGEGGVFDAARLEATLRGPRRNAPRPRLVWIEQTTNLGGGRVWPLATLKSVRNLALSRGLAVHIDGARLLNAACAHEVAPAQYGALADSVWIDFTKGLGAPFGAVLAGDAGFIEAARRFKHMLGGAMRQAGIMAAACLYALEHNVARLEQDHAAARTLAEGLKGLPGLYLVAEPETNIVLLRVQGEAAEASRISQALREHGVHIGVFDGGLLRLVTHRDVSSEGVDLAIWAFQRVCGRRIA